VFLTFMTSGWTVLVMLAKLTLGFSKVAITIVRFLLPALNLLRIALLINPLGLLITAVAGAVVVGYLFFTHWKQITAWFKTHFPTAFQAISAFIKGFIEGISPALKDFMAAIQPLKEVFSQLFHAVKPIFESIFSFFRPAHEAISKTSNATKQLNSNIKATANTFKIFKVIGEVIGYLFSIPIKGIIFLIQAITFFVNLSRTAFHAWTTIIHIEFRIATATFHFYIQAWIRVFKLLEEAGIFVFTKIAQAINLVKKIRGMQL